MPIGITAGGGGTSKLLGRFSRIPAKDKVLFSRQLSTLINAGLPLVQSLRNVGEQTTNKKFKVVINHIIADVEGGSALSVAMTRHPDVFNQVYLSLLRPAKPRVRLTRRWSAWRFSRKRMPTSSVKSAAP